MGQRALWIRFLLPSGNCVVYRLYLFLFESFSKHRHKVLQNLLISKLSYLPCEVTKDEAAQYMCASVRKIKDGWVFPFLFAGYPQPIRILRPKLFLKTDNNFIHNSPSKLFYNIYILLRKLWVVFYLPLLQDS